MKDKRKELPWDGLCGEIPASLEARVKASLDTLTPRPRHRALRPALACALMAAAAMLALAVFLPRSGGAPDRASQSVPLSASSTGSPAITEPWKTADTASEARQNTNVVTAADTFPEARQNADTAAEARQNTNVVTEAQQEAGKAAEAQQEINASPETLQASNPASEPLQTSGTASDTAQGSVAAAESSLATVDVTDLRFDGYRAELTLRITPADPEHYALYNEALPGPEPELFETGSDPQAENRSYVRPLCHDRILFFQPMAVLVGDGGGMLLEDWHAERDENGALRVHVEGGIFASSKGKAPSAQASLFLSVRFLSPVPSEVDDGGVLYERDGVEFNLSLNAEAQTCAEYLPQTGIDPILRSLLLTRTPLSGYLTAECDPEVDPEILSGLFFCLRGSDGEALALFGGNFFCPPQDETGLPHTAVFSLELPEEFPAALTLVVCSAEDGSVLHVFPFTQPGLSALPYTPMPDAAVHETVEYTDEVVSVTPTPLPESVPPLNTETPSEPIAEEDITFDLFPDPAPTELPLIPENVPIAP